MSSTSTPPDDQRPEADVQPQDGRIASGFRVVSLLTLFSRVLGMVRDMAMAYAFGAGPLMDAFSVAFRVPNLARRLFGEGALATAFLPVFMRELETNGPGDARRVATAVTFSLGLTLLGLVLVGEVLLGLLWLVVPSGGDARTLILLTAEMLPYLLLICVAAQLSAVLQSVEQFFWPALLPTVLNIVWITTIFLVLRFVDTPFLQIQLVSMSVVLAGLLQCGMVLWRTHATGFGFASGWQTAMPQVREMTRMMLPILFGLSVTQINTIGDSLLAWGLAKPTAFEVTAPTLWGDVAWPLESGTASALFYAQRMYLFPVGVFGIALGTVLFPLLSRHAERGDREQVGRDQTFGLRLTIAIGLPASVGLMLLSERIAVLVFQRGAFTAAAASLTGDCIVAYGFGVWAFLGLIIINRGFYALGDRQTPIRYGLYAVGLNLILNLLLLWPLAGSGLAWATSISAIVQVALSIAAYQQQFGLLNFTEVTTAAVRTILVTAVMALTCWGTMTVLPIAESTISRLLAVAGPMTAAITVYLLVAKMAGLREPFALLSHQLDDPETSTDSHE